LFTTEATVVYGGGGVLSSPNICFTVQLPNCHIRCMTSSSCTVNFSIFIILRIINLNSKQLSDVSPSIAYHSQIYELFVTTASIYWLINHKYFAKVIVCDVITNIS